MVKKDRKRTHQCRLCKTTLRDQQWIGPTHEGFYYCPPGRWQECEDRSLGPAVVKA